MKAGRELDALVAEKLMGILKRPFDSTKEFIIGMPQDKQNEIDWTISCAHYSTDIAAAWEVVEKLKWAEPELTWSDEQHCWCLYLFKKPVDGAWPTSESAPHAICLTALKAVGVDIEIDEEEV